jgi:N-acyl-phosphatidylethanolamine-hydrolysing phospholipase D
VNRLVAALLVLALGDAPVMASPPHHDPKGGFRNLEPWERAGPLVTIPFFLRRIGATIVGRDGAPAAVANDGAALRENARHSTPTITWIGHATVLVQMDHVTFLTDPIWSDTASPISFLGPRRFIPPALPLDALPPLDFVVVSHNHYDHLDLETLRALAARGTRFFVPLGVGTLLRDEGIGPVEELDWWESREVRGVAVHCVPARHWSQRGLTDFSQTLWSGWAVVGPTRRFYFAGDTGYTTSFRDIGARLGPFQLAALPIGAYDPPAMMQPVHMNPEEAVQAGLDVGAQRMLGVHWGTFDLTDEPVDEPPRRFHAAALAQGVDAARIWTPPPGETRPW